MTESDLLEAVAELCGELRLLWHHSPDSRRSLGTRGFPDLVIAGEHGIIFAELKSADGEMSGEQSLWEWTLDRATGESCDECDGPCTRVFLWRPADLENGRIRRNLQMIV